MRFIKDFERRTEIDNQRTIYVPKGTEVIKIIHLGNLFKIKTRSPCTKNQTNSFFLSAEEFSEYLAE